MQIFSLFLVLGLVFGIPASLMAYLITYNEWLHHYSDKKRPRRVALETAILAFSFFFLISIIAGLLFGR